MLISDTQSAVGCCFRRGSNLRLICSQASRAAIPYRSILIDAAVGEAFAIVLVEVSEMIIKSSEIPKHWEAIWMIFVKSP
jgi:hypothetical protein